MRFGMFLADKCENLKKACRAMPEVPSDIPPARDIFESMSYGSNAELWSNCNLKDCFKYLRGGKKLRIPEEWKDLMPRVWPGESATS